MKIIKLTDANADYSKYLYVNVAHIGDILRIENARDVSGRIKPPYTAIGITTFNNGSREVKETPEEIMQLIKSSLEI